ncbi:hypothetical protein [Streptomyces sp. NPDC005301]|uniref:hypothetical protein n=1 Tax=Streptomyces sp. NPDC005301 TaxID=3156874 RepID=UPI0033BCAC02
MVGEERFEAIQGCPAQGLAEDVDAEGTPVAAADTEDERREGEGRVQVQRLAQQPPGGLADRGRPVGAADHDQGQQTGVPGRLVHRLLTDPPVPVAEGESQPGLVEPGPAGELRRGAVPPGQVPQPVTGQRAHSRVQREPGAGVRDGERVPERHTVRQPHRRRRSVFVTHVFRHFHPFGCPPG